MNPLESRVTAWGGLGLTMIGVFIALTALLFGPMIAVAVEDWHRTQETGSEAFETPNSAEEIRHPNFDGIESNADQTQGALQLLTPLNEAEFAGCVQFVWASGGLNEGEQYEVFVTRMDSVDVDTIRLSSKSEQITWQPTVGAPARYRWRVVVYDNDRTRIRKQSAESEFSWKGGGCDK